jgi:hypothetical protein
MTEKTLEELAAEAAAVEAAAAEAAAAEEVKFQRAQADPAIVSRAGIINGMAPEEIRARILAAAA